MTQFLPNRYKTGDDKTTEEKVFEAVEDELPFLMELMKR